MKKWLLPVGIILLIASVLTPFFTNFVREVIVIPLLYLFWIGRFFFEGIPQGWLWGIFVGVCLFILLISLPGKRKSKSRTAPFTTVYTGRITEWAKLINQAQKDDYFKWRLAQHLQKLTLSAIAHHKGQSVKETRRQLGQGELDLPPALQAYFQASLQPLGSLPAPKRFFRVRPQHPSPLDLDPIHVVEYLEYLNAKDSN